MRQLRWLAFVTAALVFAGWETSTANDKAEIDSALAEVAFTGDSNADERLKRDTLKVIATLVKTKGCDSIDHVDSKVFHYESTKGEEGHVWGKEGWMVTGCSRPFPFLITFTEDGKGGSFFAVSMK